MRKLVVIFITIISLLGMTGTVYAEVGISEIHFSAQVPEEFDRDINVLLEFEDTNTGLFTLKVNNGYELDSVIQTGNAVLKQIDIIGNIGQYEVNAPEEINIKKDEQANFNITIKEVKLDSIGEKIEDDTEVETKINADIKKDTIDKEDKKDNEEQEIKIDEANKKEDSTNDIKVRLIKSIFSTAIILIVVLAIYLVVKYKKEN